MFNNLIINPWKLAFIFIFFSNIIFHASPAFLLLFVLFAIFMYAYIFLALLFNDFSEEFIKGVKSGYTPNYEQSYNTLNNLNNYLSKFRGLLLLARRFLNLRRTNLLTYSCVPFPNNRNYIFLNLFSYYASAREGVESKEEFKIIQFNDFKEKVSFLQRGLDRF